MPQHISDPLLCYKLSKLCQITVSRDKTKHRKAAFLGRTNPQKNFEIIDEGFSASNKSCCKCYRRFSELPVHVAVSNPLPPLCVATCMCSGNLHKQQQTGGSCSLWVQRADRPTRHLLMTKHSVAAITAEITLYEKNRLQQL